MLNPMINFTGHWLTTFGPMDLTQQGTAVRGTYHGVAGEGTLEGTVAGNVLSFRYQVPVERGHGFGGQWQPEGSERSGAWLGRRVMPTAGLTWLIVLEAHWQTSFADREYSFGNMLKEFFARLAHVAVRHRFFNDEASLERW